MDGLGGFHHGFGQRRVRVDGARDVFGRRAHFDREGGLGDQLGDFRADHLHAEDFVGVGVGDDFDKAFGLEQAHRAPGRCERELADLDFMALLFRFVFGQADGGHFRRSEDHGRHAAHVVLFGLAGDHCRGNETLFRALVREHRLARQVAGAKDVRHLGAHLLVGFNVAKLVDFEAGLFERETFDERTASNRAQDLIAIQRVHRAALVLKADFERVALFGPALGKDFRLHVDLGLLHAALNHLDAVTVLAGKRAGGRFEHGYLAAELVVHHAELEADVTAADHDEVFRNTLGNERARRRPDVVFVKGKARDLGRDRTRRDHDVVRVEHRHAIGAVDLDARLAFKTRFAHDVRDLVLLEQAADAAGQALDNRLLPIDQFFHVQAELLHGDAHHGRALHFFHQRAGSDHRFRWNATDVKARAAQFALFDDGNGLAQLGEANGANIAGGTGSDDDDLAAHVLCGWL